MDASRLNKLAMYQSVDAVLLKPEYDALWTTIPGFVKWHGEFKRKWIGSLRTVGNMAGGKPAWRRTRMLPAKPCAKRHW